MTDLTEWLRGQLDDEQRAAEDAAGHRDGRWKASRSADDYLHSDGPRVNVGDDFHWAKTVNAGVWLCDDLDDDCEYMRETWMRQAQHIARWDPERVLAEVAAKRNLIALHTGDGHACIKESIGYTVVGWYADPEPCPTLQLLAAPYADHEDYDPAWSVPNA